MSKGLATAAAVVGIVAGTIATGGALGVIAGVAGVSASTIGTVGAFAAAALMATASLTQPKGSCAGGCPTFRLAKDTS